MLKKLVVGVISAGVTATALGVGSAQANDGSTPTSKTTSRLASVPASQRKSMSSMRMARRHAFRKSSARHDWDPRLSDPWQNYMLSGDHHKRQDNESFNVINVCDLDILGLHHLLGGEDERGKCAQSSFNSN